MPTTAPSARQKFSRGIVEGLTPVVSTGRMSLSEYAKQAWGVIESAPYLHGDHIDAICQHLEAVTDGQIHRLLINVGPRHTKSLLVSVLWPTWEWGPAGTPHIRYLCTSHAIKVALDHASLHRKLVMSGWYTEQWGSHVRILPLQSQKSLFKNDRGGQRYSSPLGGRLLGAGGERLVLDDPHDWPDRLSPLKLQNAIESYDTLSTRGNQPRDTPIVVVAQRVAENDLSQYLIDSGTFVHLNLPTLFDPESRCRVFLNSDGTPSSPDGENAKLFWEDSRTQQDELLNPLRFPIEVIREEQKHPVKFSAMHQQKPTPQEGDEVKRHWFGYWMDEKDDLPPVVVRLEDGTIETIHPVTRPAILRMTTSWDMAFKDMKTSSYVVGQVWGWPQDRSKAFLLDQVRDKLSFPKSKAALVALAVKWPDAHQHLVEDKANGPAIMASLKGATIDGKPLNLLPVEPGADSKMSRAEAVSDFIQGGRVYLPHPAKAGFTPLFINEWCGLPNPSHWDQIDASSQFLKKLWIVPKKRGVTW